MDNRENSVRRGRRLSRAYSPSFGSATDRGFRPLNHARWIVGESGEKLLHVLAGGRIDVQIELLRVGEELAVAHGGLECLAQDLESLLRQIGRGGDRPSQRDLVEVEFQDFPI